MYWVFCTRRHIYTLRTRHTTLSFWPFASTASQLRLCCSSRPCTAPPPTFALLLLRAERLASRRPLVGRHSAPASSPSRPAPPPRVAGCLGLLRALQALRLSHLPSLLAPWASGCLRHPSSPGSRPLHLSRCYSSSAAPQAPHPLRTTPADQLELLRSSMPCTAPPLSSAAATSSTLEASGSRQEAEEEGLSEVARRHVVVLSLGCPC